MGRHITVMVDCDWVDCDVTAVEGDGIVTAKTLSIDGKQAKEFMLCKPHADDFDEFLLPLMQKGIKVGGATKAPSTRAGTPRSAPPGTSDSLVCKVAECDRRGRPLHNRTGMAQHVIRAHGYDSLAAYETEFGTVENHPPVDETS